jgi:5-methyltetrahydropteroyltriglutamate--homocysteine methyltransferase
MKRSTDRILVSHAGALPRPPDLRDLLIAKEDGKPYDEAAYDRRVREVVSEVVQKQVETGIDVVNDGEESKRSFSSYARVRISGFVEREVDTTGRPDTIYLRDLADFPGFFGAGRSAFGGQGGLAASFTTTATHVFCVEPLKYIGEAAIAKDIEVFKASLHGKRYEEAFLPAVAPGTVEHWMTNEYYKNDEEFVYAIAEAMAPEYKAIVDAGFVLQIDDPDLADGWQLHTEMSVAEYRKFAGLRLDALKHALQGCPAERVRFHMCWGSYHGPHKHDIPLEDIVDLILKVPAQAYSVEASNPCHEHEWRVWENGRLPEGKLLIPGVVGHFSDFIEHPQLIAERLVRYARVIGRENLVAGTDCGLGGRVGHAQIAWAKLESMAEGARLASRQLWP